jgi:hypothetical protein
MMYLVLNTLSCRCDTDTNCVRPPRFKGENALPHSLALLVFIVLTILDDPHLFCKIVKYSRQLLIVYLAWQWDWRTGSRDYVSPVRSMINREILKWQWVAEIRFDYDQPRTIWHFHPVQQSDGAFATGREGLWYSGVHIFWWQHHHVK